MQSRVLLSVEGHFSAEGFDLIFIANNLDHVLVLLAKLHFFELVHLLLDAPLVKLHVLVELALRVDQHELKIALQFGDQFL